MIKRCEACRASSGRQTTQYSLHLIGARLFKLPCSQLILLTAALPSCRYVLFTPASTCGLCFYDSLMGSLIYFITFTVKSSLFVIHANSEWIKWDEAAMPNMLDILCPINTSIFWLNWKCASDTCPQTHCLEFIINDEQKSEFYLRCANCKLTQLATRQK